MARTTSALVAGIIEVDEDINLTPFIEAANILVTQCCTDLTDDYTTDELEKIETWLAAHFYTVRDMRAVSEKAGSVSERFQSKVDLGLSTSHYGQMAMTLDYQGGLASLNKEVINGVSKNVGVTYIGTTKEEYEALNE
jgi:hypothetical protein